MLVLPGARASSWARRRARPRPGPRRRDGRSPAASTARSHSGATAPSGPSTRLRTSRSTPASTFGAVQALPSGAWRPVCRTTSRKAVLLTGAPNSAFSSASAIGGRQTVEDVRQLDKRHRAASGSGKSQGKKDAVVAWGFQTAIDSAHRARRASAKADGAAPRRRQVALRPPLGPVTSRLRPHPRARHRRQALSRRSPLPFHSATWPVLRISPFRARNPCTHLVRNRTHDDAGDLFCKRFRRSRLLHQRGSQLGRNGRQKGLGRERLGVFLRVGSRLPTRGLPTDADQASKADKHPDKPIDKPIEDLPQQ